MATCARCRRELVGVETAAGAALACGGCDHVWLDPDGFERLHATVERRYVPADVDALRTEAAARKQAALDRPVVYCDCPACGRRMLRRTFGQASFVLVHFCAGHGFWVHRDDLDAIAAYVARGGELIEMAEAAEDQARRVRQLERADRDLGQRAESGGGFLILPF